MHQNVKFLSGSRGPDGPDLPSPFGRKFQLSVQFEQVQDSVQEESTSGPSQLESDFVTVAEVKELTQRYQLMALAEETRRNYF